MANGISVKVIDHTKDVIKAKDEQILTALEAIGAEAVTNAQKETPVDTGRLRNSIAWATEENSAGHPMKGEGGPSIPNGTPEKHTLYIGTNVEYAEKQEFGDYRHKVGKKHFLRDSVTNHIDRYKAIMQAALKA